MTTPQINSLFVINTEIKVPQQIWTAGSGAQPFIFNNDEVNTLYIGPQADVWRQDESSTIPVPPLGGQSWPDVDIYAFAPVAVNMLIVPGASAWAPSPVQVQIALIAAGLATAANQVTGISSVDTVNSTLGTPAQTDDVVTTLPANIQTMGAPPFVTGLQEASAFQHVPADSPVAIFYAPAAGARLWNGTLSLAVAGTPSYAGVHNPFCSLYNGTPANIFAMLQGTIIAPSTIGMTSVALPLNGYPVAGGTAVYLGINAGTSVTDMEIVAGVALTYSSP